MLAAMRTALAESSIHGLPRIFAVKHRVQKVMWLALVLTMTSLLLYGGSVQIRKLFAGEVATLLQPNGADFVFPDIYLCSHQIVSASTVADLTDSQVDELNSHLNASTDRFNNIYRRHMGNSNFAYHASAQTVMSSIPYSVIANLLAPSKSQAIPHFILHQDNSLEIEPKRLQFNKFHHYSNPACFQLNISQDTIEELQASGSNPANKISLVFFLDPYFQQLSQRRRSSKEIRKIYVANGVPIHESSWTITNTEYHLDMVPRLEIIVVPPGHYPSIFEHRITLLPGLLHSVRMGLTIIENDAKKQDGRCIDAAQPMKLINPSSGVIDQFKYSYFTCYANESRRLLTETPIVNEADPISPIRLPLMPSVSNAMYFLNLSVTNDSSVDHIFSHLLSGDYHRVENLPAIVGRRCTDRDTCTQYQYSTKASSLPIIGSNPSAVISYSQFLLGSAGNLTSKPGFQFLQELSTNATADSSFIPTLRDYIQRSFVSIYIYIEEGKSDIICRTYAYTFTNFLSDCGGLMGLYLGMSLLTLFEIFDCLTGLMCVKVEPMKAKPAGAVNEQQLDDEGSVS